MSGAFTRGTISLILSLWCAGAVGQTVRLDAGDRHISLEWYAPNIIRVRVVPGNERSVKGSLSVIAAPALAGAATKEERGRIVTSSRSMTVQAEKKTGALVFSDNRKRVFLRAAGVSARTIAVAGDTAGYACRQTFGLTPGEGIYGLGQFEDPVVNYRGQDMLLVQANRTALNPFLVSTKGYGILWDNYSRSRFVDDATGATFMSEVADAVDYYVVYGPSLDSVVAGYRHLTGDAPMFGKWAYGYWQSKERYKSGAELTGIVREYRRRNIPLDNIIQDWSYWGGNDRFSSMQWDSSAYPAPREMIDTLHGYHAHLMVSIWPAFGTSTAIYKEMNAAGLLYPVPHWNGGRVYDAYSPVARQIYWKYVRKGLFDAGVDAFWMDATEPEFRCSDDRYATELSLKAAGRNSLGEFARYLNPYSMFTTQAVYENHRAVTDRKRVFILTRSSFAGQQRYAAATWSGDTFATWDALRVQIAAGINFSMAGIPYWTHDIGGFITDIHYPLGTADPAYRELYVRWFQFGAFCPVFRAHGTSTPREIWRFGEPGDWAYDALVASDRLRYRLMPYLYSTAWKVTHEGYSFIRGLPMEFPADRKVYPIADQYMFGSAFMVCPVTHPMKHAPEFGGVDITPGHFYSPDGKEHGAELKIYRGTDFRNLVLERKTDASQIGWSGCLPASLDSSAYSVTIRGMLAPWKTGRYILYVITDGGIRLSLGGKLLIDSADNATKRTFGAPLELTAGVKYPFRIDHRQFKGNNALLKINWVEPGSAPQDTAAIAVYLPGGSTWFDFWTGKSFRGGTVVKADAPIGRLPLFVKGGSIVPLGPAVEYAAQEADEPVELRVYPGRDADFTFYDDAGDSYDYERGEHTTIPIHWNDRKKTLTLGDEQGTYPGAPATRRFSVAIVRGGEPKSAPRAGGTVLYMGKMKLIKF